MNELLAKALSQHQVATALTSEDAAKVLEYLRAEGGPDIDKAYKASARLRRGPQGLRIKIGRVPLLHLVPFYNQW